MIETEFGKYQLRGVLGSGGLAMVYQAYDTELNRDVALKILNANWPAKSVVARRFRRELEIAQNLQHPHIISIYEYGEVNERLYLAMEYMAKGSFSHYFAKARSLRLGITARILRELASALDYAHTQGVVHRDLKLENILLGENNRLVLTDFGIAYVPNSTRLTVTGDVFGTPMYISPEQISAVKAVDFRADCYALAIIAYLLSVGYFPFSSDSSWEMLHQHLNIAPPLPSNLNPRLPEALNAVLMRGLAKDPLERYPSAGEFAATFSKAIKGAETAETVVLAWQPTPQATMPQDYVGLESFLNSPFRTSALIMPPPTTARRRWSLKRVAAGLVTVALVGAFTVASARGGWFANIGLALMSGVTPDTTQILEPSASPAPATAVSGEESVAALPSEEALIAFIPTNTLAPTETFAPTNTVAPTSTFAPTETLAPTMTSTREATLPVASPTWYASAIPLGTQSSAPQGEALLFSALLRRYAEPTTAAPEGAALSDATEINTQGASATTAAPRAALMTSTPTLIPATRMPATVVPPTSIPATAIPATRVPPTNVPPTPIPPTSVPPTQVPPTNIPPTSVPPTSVPPTQVPPTNIPPTAVPPTSVPPTNVPQSSGGLLDPLLPPIVPTLIGKIL